MTPQLDEQTVVGIGGSADIGLATARAAREEVAEVILAARNPERLNRPHRRSARECSGSVRCPDAEPVGLRRPPA
jgi:NADP-dependent 3-hydroxy acid dehydrogenase YdfG